jgi:hypothetical protein
MKMNISISVPNNGGIVVHGGDSTDPLPIHSDLFYGGLTPGSHFGSFVSLSN